MTDNLCRPVRTYHPYIESSTHPDSLYNPCTGSNPTDYRYDTKDRTIHISLPDGSTETNTFAIHTTAYPQAHHTHTDRNGNTSTITTDAKGRRLQTILHTNNDSLITHYGYDLLSQPTTITDPEGNTTTYEYDRIGRVTSIYRPDQGLTKTSYDPAGHITDIETSQGEHISYKYNYDQLISKTYSERYWNDSHYEYGSPTDGNASGRVIKIQDASGIKEQRYDRMGNIDHERHTLVQPYSNYTITLETHREYDKWGRINTIEYPDGEKVSYDYDQGGGLTSIIGDKDGRITKYLTDMHYDHYGNRTHEISGNDVETHYHYDPVTLRLKQMTNLSHQSGTVLQDNHYSYDRNGNLTNIEDHGQNRRTQYYEYDALNRLTYSKGNIDNQGTDLWYESNYNYTANGKMQQKQTDSRKLNNTFGIHDIHTAYRYNYNNDQPNTIESIYDEESGLSKYYKWDGKGNMTYRYDEQNKTNTKMCWTEDNRMQAYVQMNEGTDKGRAAYYGYNTTGERYVRYIGTTINITQNGITFHRPVLQSPVLYANSLITLNGKGYTKHYFEGDRRVCSKIGGGFTGRTEDDINDRIQPIEGEYEELFEQQYTGIKETFANCIGTEMEFNLKYDPYKTIMENELGRDEAEPAFYYQGDHLGSSAYLTDDAGAITQTLNYLPYGEDWVDVHNNPNYLSRYKYNGKEKDPESGLHYYGARYYDSDISQWLSIDPMADKYPSLSPYIYCADNPVILLDPDGRDIWEINRNGKVVNHIKDRTQDAFYIVKQDANGNYQRIKTTDANGNAIDVGISFRYGTVRYRRPEIDIQNKDGSVIPTRFTIFEIKGDDNATRLFEFMANPQETTNVEWTHAKIGFKNSGRNIVGTSHDTKSTAIGAYLRDTQYTLREVNHNHPRGTGPSIKEEDGRRWGDIPAAALYYKSNKSIKLNVYIHPGIYIEYDKNGVKK